MATKPRRGTKIRYGRGVISLCLCVSVVGALAQGVKNDLLLTPYPLKLSTELTLPNTAAFSYWRDIPMLEASVNGNLVRERVALSTGLSALTVSKDAYTRNKIQALPSQHSVSAMEKTDNAPAALVKMLQFENVLFSDLPFTIHDTAIQLLQKDRADAPGVWLGAPLLMTCQITFDFPNRTLLLESRKAALPNEEKRVEVPLIFQNNRPYVKMQAGNGKTFLALVDTGSPGTLIPSDIATKLKLTPETTVPMKNPDGSQTSLGLATLSLLKIGALEERGVRVGFLNPGAPVSFNKNFAVLGMNVMRKYRICFNTEKKKAVFMPPKTREEQTETPTTP